MDYEERQALRNRRVNINAYVPMTLVEVIDQIAHAENTPSPRVIERLLRKGLAAERDERAAKQRP